MNETARVTSRVALAAVAALMMAPASEAEAQWDSQPHSPDSPAVVAPQPPPAPGTPSQAWPPELVTEPPATPPPKKKEPKIQPQWGLGIGVPLWLDVDRDVVRPGAQLDFWGAADFGFITLGGRLGFGWTPVELSNTGIPDLQRFGRNPLRRINFSPEVRLQIPGKKVMPYLSNAFDMNWWNFLETSVGCGWWYCSSFAVYRFSPGYTGRVGIGIRAVKTFHVDLGFSWSLTGKGDFFDEKYWFIGPYAGILFRR